MAWHGDKLVVDRAEEPGTIASTTRPTTPHYQQGGIEPIDFINSHDMNFNLGNAIKYVTRCNHKGTKAQDLRKAIDYINFELEKETK